MKQNRLAIQEIQSTIVNLPGRPPFMLAQTLAVIYEVDVKYINRAVKRNPKRFPADFCFQLTDIEWENLRSQIGTSSCDEPDLRCQNGTSSHGGIRYIPYAFTREGANQLSTVLHSPVAIDRSIQIMRAFSEMEHRSLAQQERRNRAAVRQGQIEWQQARLEGMVDRKELTDAIKRLQDLANEQNPGNNSRHMYSQFTRMICDILFRIKKVDRNDLPAPALRKLQMAEFQAAQWVDEQVDRKVDYHEPYYKVKERMKALVEIIGTIDPSVQDTAKDEMSRTG